MVPVIIICILDILQDPFINIAPKKPNWDLRRDVQKKLDKLERRTQKAMYKIVRKYLSNLFFWWMKHLLFVSAEGLEVDCHSWC